VVPPAGIVPEVVPARDPVPEFRAIVTEVARVTGESAPDACEFTTMENPATALTGDPPFICTILRLEACAKPVEAARTVRSRRANKGRQDFMVVCWKRKLSVRLRGRQCAAPEQHGNVAAVIKGRRRL
jgi:hypothetical protein